MGKGEREGRKPKATKRGIKMSGLERAEMQPESDLYKSLKGTDMPFFLMAGPNVIQSEEHCMKMCRQIKQVVDPLGIPYIFKSSFDKANRTNAASFRGPGMEEGLKVLERVKTTFDVPIVTDIHEPWQA